MKHADDWFRGVLCLSTALMMAISWPLWVTGGEFPRVPWFGWVRLLSEWASWVRFVVGLIAMVVAAVPLRGLRGEKVGQIALGTSLAMSAWMVLEDQFRLQPWMYQFLLMGLAIVACPKVRARTLCRWLLIALYFHSGLSKLEWSFMNSTGRDFLFHLTRHLGVVTPNWPLPVQNALALAMPCFELAVAFLLAFRLRRIGVVGAVLQHASLLVILGPLGFDHSANVLIWNAVLILEVFFLFWWNQPPGALEISNGRFPGIASNLVATVAIAAMVLPFGERTGFWDTWPSFGLYATSNEASLGYVITSNVNAFPGPKQLTYDQTGRPVGLTMSNQQWSLEERRVPLYPSCRAFNGVAEAFATRYGDQGTVKVVHYLRANRRSGIRQQTTLFGTKAIRKFGDTFWLNAHPAR